MSGKGLKAFDVIIVGSGLAGLYAALQLPSQARVCLICKSSLLDTTTRLAQGGVAAAISPDDSPYRHLEDTLSAGAGLCNKEMAGIMVEEGPECVKDLLSFGVPFDREHGKLAITREGAHTERRVIHAGGDATGRYIQEILVKNLAPKKNIAIMENIFVTDLLVKEGAVCGVKTLSETLLSRAVILATGGLGQIFASTTNPQVATGDGVAMALRAGAEVTDMEFIQFHPTVFQGKKGNKFLVSEALRGEGALLRNAMGEAFMETYHQMGDLGPRDIVARGILDQMSKGNSSCVYLDITHRDNTFLQKRFPTIFNMALENGYNIGKDWLPVAPAAHYAMGGIKSGSYGETNLEGLFACGEVAGTGIHGANRLASNSLLEALVFARRAVRYIEENSAKRSLAAGKWDFSPVDKKHINSIKQDKLKKQLRQLMFTKAGIIRHGSKLNEASHFIRKYASLLAADTQERTMWELQNLFCVAGLIVAGALSRKESRGSHFREDYPCPDDAYTYHICQSKKAKGDELFAQALL